MTKYWYPEYIKKYESMKKDTPDRKMGKRHEKKTFLYMGKTKFHRKGNMFTYRRKKLNFINNQGNLNKTHSKT